MSIDPPLSPRAIVFRQAITEFIAERREAKLKGLDGEKATEATAKYEYHTWLADAARRVSQIQAVTHVLKATHPDARGSSLYAHPNTLPNRAEIGTHLLGDQFEDDIVGNAAALDVYKFLKVAVEGRRIIDWMQLDDVDLLAVLNPDGTTAQEWVSAFKGLIRQADSFASHVTAKQTFWCVNGDPTQDENFHLLQNLFPSSLVHRVYQELNNARFGEANKVARQAYKEKKFHTETYRNYSNIAVRKLGGTKPQNISQLNSERGGVNYLLSSAPPIWKSGEVTLYVSTESVFNRFHRFGKVDELISRLSNLLKGDSAKVMKTRQKREHLEIALARELASLGSIIRNSMEPGWTRNPECRLKNLYEKLWLDPERADLPIHPEYQIEDLEFQRALEWKDWPDEVATHFAQWMNDILRKQDLPVGDAEFKHWAKQAIIDADWPATMRRKPRVNNLQVEAAHD